jgi:hypothetical protein
VGYLEKLAKRQPSEPSILTKPTQHSFYGHSDIELSSKHPVTRTIIASIRDASNREKAAGDRGRGWIR